MLRTNTHLKTKADANQIEVGFYGRVARIVRVHQFGLRDRLSQNGVTAKYEERRLLGLNETDKNTIEHLLLRALT